MSPRYGDPAPIVQAIDAQSDDIRRELLEQVLEHDPLERLAMALSALSYHTPEDVGQLFLRRDLELLEQWIGPLGGHRETSRADRQLYRRRAKLANDVLMGRAGE